jgi:hypothetical protein
MARHGRQGARATAVAGGGTDVFDRADVEGVGEGGVEVVRHNASAGVALDEGGGEQNFRQPGTQQSSAHCFERQRWRSCEDGGRG